MDAPHRSTPWEVAFGYQLLTARERLMLTITHDIKAPAGSFAGYIDLLERITTDERQHFYLGNMRTSAPSLVEACPFVAGLSPVGCP